MKPTPLTLKKKLALELWRQQENMLRKEHPLKQLFWECTLRCDREKRHAEGVLPEGARQYRCQD